MSSSRYNSRSASFLSCSRSLRARSSAVSDTRECVIGSVTMMVGVGGTVADIERRTVTLRLFMRPYLADNDCEAIAVELVSVVAMRKFCGGIACIKVVLY